MASLVPPATAHTKLTNSDAAETEESILLLRRLLFDSSARVLFITGAGISVKSGIPLYRSDREKIATPRSDSTDLSSTGCPEEGEKSDEACIGNNDDEDPKAINGPVSSTLLASSTTSGFSSSSGWCGTTTNSPGNNGTDGNKAVVIDEDEEAYVAISDDETFGESFQSVQPVFEPVSQLQEDRKSEEIKQEKTEKKQDIIGLIAINTDEKKATMNLENQSDDDDEYGTTSSSTSQPIAIWDAKLEALCQKRSFLVDPRAWYKYFWFDTHHVNKFLNAVPNESHFAIGMLCDKFPNRIRCVTQNVDGLHQQGGCPSGNLIEVHGRIGVYRCCHESCPNGSINALYPQDIEFLTAEEELAWNAPLRLEQCPSTKKLFEMERLRAGSKSKATAFPIDEDFPLPCCYKCRSPLLPMTLMFDETYQTHEFFQFDTVCQWMEEADVFVFAGTSFSVFFTEHALHLARFRRKQVFNININRDDEAFCGFMNRNTAPLVSKDMNSRLSVCFNWDSDASDSEAVGDISKDTPQKPSAKDDDSDLFEQIALFGPTINHIVAPADIALASVLPETYRVAVHEKVACAKIEKWKRLWDTK